MVSTESSASPKQQKGEGGEKSVLVTTAEVRQGPLEDRLTTTGRLQGNESVGTLGAGESYTAVERVDLSLSDALAIERNDGWITVETTVRSDAEAMTTVERREVA